MLANGLPLESMSHSRVVALSAAIGFSQIFQARQTLITSFICFFHLTHLLIFSHTQNTHDSCLHTLTCASPAAVHCVPSPHLPGDNSQPQSAAPAAAAPLHKELHRACQVRKSAGPLTLQQQCSASLDAASATHEESVAECVTG